MISLAELEDIAATRLHDAKVLLEATRFDGATYLCGYAVERSLNARICRTLTGPASAQALESLAIATITESTPM
jgi:hypothetical protein